MKWGQSPVVLMALYLAARAGTAHAGDAAPPDLPTDDDDRDGLVSEDTGADLESIPVALGRPATVDEDALAQAAPDGPAPIDLAREVPGAATDLDTARFAPDLPGPASGEAASQLAAEASEAAAPAADDPVFAAAGIAPEPIDIAAPGDGTQGQGAHEPGRGLGSIFPLDLDLSYADHVSDGGLPDDAGGGPDDAILASSASAQSDDAIFATGKVETVSDAELAEQRGGFVYQGVDIRLGAEIRSYIGDELVLQTNLNWTDNTANVQRIVSTELSPAAAAGVAAGLVSGNGINLRIGGDDVYVANDGQTAFVQRLDGSLQNIVVNTANNIALRQQVDVQLDVSNFAPFQADALGGRISATLTDMIGSALVASIGR